jgi:methylmalonyl-CoA mutase N-terminal domain/subunit
MKTAIPERPAGGEKDRAGERRAAFTTISGRPIERLYTAGHLESWDYDRDDADPGVFPYTRGIHESGYRGKLWTMRQFAGFGTRRRRTAATSSCSRPAAPV